MDAVWRVLALVGAWKWTLTALALGLFCVRAWRASKAPRSEAELARLRSWDRSQIDLHGEIERLADDLWVVQGRTPYGLPRAMTVFALPSGGLLIYSAVALHEDAMRELESLGVPELLVVPSHRHTRDALRYATRYPRMHVYCSEEDLDAVRELVPRACAFGDDARMASLGIDVRRVVGVRAMLANERVLLLPVCNGRKRAALFCDLLFNLTPPMCTWITRALGSGPFFGVTRIGWFGIRSKSEFRQWLGELGAIKRLAFVLVAHGQPVVETSSGESELVIPHLFAQAL